MDISRRICSEDGKDGPFYNANRTEEHDDWPGLFMTLEILSLYFEIVVMVPLSDLEDETAWYNDNDSCGDIQQYSINVILVRMVQID